MESFGDDSRSENDDGEVGYRKPPKHSRFKKGRSGNPRGKLRGTRNSAALLKEALLAAVFVRQNGRQTKTSKLQVIVTKLIHSAMKGDYNSTRLLFEYVGLDRLLNAPEPQILRPSEAIAHMRRIMNDDSYWAETNPDGASNEIVPAPANSEQGAQSRTRDWDQPYKVGFRKPPEHTRFQKGQSGNPFGRPKAAKSSRTLILQMLDEEVCVTENGKERALSRIQVIFTQIVNKAAMGDRKFLALLLEYAPAVDATLRRPLAPEILEQVKIFVRGRLD